MEKQIWDVFKSKRFWTLLASLAALFVTALVPELEDVQAELITAIAALGVVVVAGYSLQDAAREMYNPLALLVAATKSKADDNALAMVVELLRAAGIEVKPPEKPVVQ